jgi:hypothetical protein
MPCSSSYGIAVAGRSGRQGIPPLDSGSDTGSALRGRDARGGFHRHGFLGQGIIFDRLAKPPRIVALVKMVEPGLVVDAVGQLKKVTRFWALRLRRSSGPRK